MADIDFDFFDEGPSSSHTSPKHTRNTPLKDRPPSGLAGRESPIFSKVKPESRSSRYNSSSSDDSNGETYRTNTPLRRRSRDDNSSDGMPKTKGNGKDGRQVSSASHEELRYSSSSGSDSEDSHGYRKGDRGSRPVSRIEIRKKKVRSSSSSFDASSGTDAEERQIQVPVGLPREERHRVNERRGRPPSYKKYKSAEVSDSHRVKEDAWTCGVASTSRSGRKQVARLPVDHSSSDSELEDDRGSHIIRYESRGSKMKANVYSRNSGSESDITHVSPYDSREVTPRRDELMELVQSYDGPTGPTPKGTRYLTGAIDQDKMNIKMLLKAILDIDESGSVKRREMVPAQGERRPVADVASGVTRQRHTFSRSKNREIESENQRLLKNLMEKNNRKTCNTRVREPVLPNRVTTSTINRLREQRKIEQENFALLKRIQGARPTKALSKNYQISDYNRQISYNTSQALIATGNGSSTGAGVRTRQRTPTTSSPYRLNVSRGSALGSVSSLQSSASTQRSRRSRPSSAVSQQSMMSRNSVQSSASRSRQSPSTTAAEAAAAAMAALGSSASRSRQRPAWESGW